MLQRPYFIVLEGLDGCGKSTLAQGLAHHLNAELLVTPVTALKELRSQVDAVFGEKGLAHALWYLAHVANAGEQVRELRAKGRSVVLDRYWMSTLAYATARDTVLEVPGVLELLPQPDYTLFLCCDREVRAKRLKARGNPLPHDLRFLDPDEEKHLLEAYRALVQHLPPGTFLELNLGDSDPDDACRDALSAMGFDSPTFHPSRATLASAEDVLRVAGPFLRRTFHEPTTFLPARGGDRELHDDLPILSRGGAQAVPRPFRGRGAGPGA